MAAGLLYYRSKNVIKATDILLCLSCYIFRLINDGLVVEVCMYVYVFDTL